MTTPTEETGKKLTGTQRAMLARAAVGPGHQGRHGASTARSLVKRGYLAKSSLLGTYAITPAGRAALTPPKGAGQ